jgi:hypothetical protein
VTEELAAIRATDARAAPAAAEPPP